MAQYKAGSVNAAKGSSQVQGLGTQFLANVSAGSMFSIPGTGLQYTIGSVDSDTQLSLVGNFLQADAVNSAYSITVDFTPALGLPEVSAGDANVLALLTQALRMLDVAISARNTGIVEAWSQAEADALRLAGYTVVVRMDLLGYSPPVTTTAGPTTTVTPTTTAPPVTTTLVPTTTTAAPTTTTVTPATTTRAPTTTTAQPITTTAAPATTTMVAPATTIAPAVPSTPTIHPLTAGPGQVTVNWGDVATEDTYSVYYSISNSFNVSTKDGANPYPTVPDAFAGKITGIAADTTQYVVTGLAPGQLYYFRVTAGNSAGTSGLSAYLSTAPQATTTAAPTTTTAAPTTTTAAPTTTTAAPSTTTAAPTTTTAAPTTTTAAPTTTTAAPVAPHSSVTFTNFAAGTSPAVSVIFSNIH